MIKTIKLLRIISKTLSTVLVALVVLLAVLLGGVRLVGLTPYTVLSGSMEPTYHVGSIIYVAKVKPTDYKIGDPVTYRMPSGIIVTHRIEEILNEGKPDMCFRTKGDANETHDGTPVPTSAIIGKPMFSIPYLGFVSDFVSHPKGLFTVIGTCMAVMIISFIIDALLPKQTDKHCGSQNEHTGSHPPEPQDNEIK